MVTEVRSGRDETATDHVAPCEQSTTLACGTNSQQPTWQHGG